MKGYRVKLTRYTQFFLIRICLGHYKKRFKLQFVDKDHWISNTVLKIWRNLDHYKKKCVFEYFNKY